MTLFKIDFKKQFLFKIKKMNSLLKSIEQNINNSVFSYIDLVCKRYDNVEKDVLVMLWKEETESIQNISKPVETKKEIKPVETKKEIKPVETKKEIIQKKSSENKGGCPYEYTKGDKKGCKCGVFPKNGGVYCSTHKKFEGKQVKPQKVLPEPIKSLPDKSSKRLSLHPTFKLFYDKESDLVFKSAKELVVVGKILNRKISAISEDDDIELCKKYGYRYETEYDVKLLEKQDLKPKKQESDNEEDEEDKPVSLFRKVEKKEEPKIFVPQTKNDSDSDNEEEEDTKVNVVQPIKDLSKTEEQIKDFCIGDINKIQTMVNKSLGCEEEELSDSD